MRFKVLVGSLLLSPGLALGQVINQDIKLLAEDGAAQDNLGVSTAVSDGIALIGASGDDDNGSSSGSAYLFDADPDSTTFGQQLIKLLPEDGAEGDGFGRPGSLAISNGIATVGAPYDDDNGLESGSAYLFDADPDSPTFGQQLRKLLPDDGELNDRFGWSVAISDGIAVVGTPLDDDNGTNSGSAYLFDADPDSPTFGQQLVKILPEDGSEFNTFGSSIDIEGGITAVGAEGDDNNGIFSGSAYLFDADPESPTFGQQLVKILPEDGAESDQFGATIGIDGGIVAVGAPRDDDNGTDSGSAHLFDADPDSPTFGQQLVKILPEAGAELDLFGATIGIDGGIVAVGATGDDDNGSDSGSAYLFDADPDSSTFGQRLLKILPDDGNQIDSFGSSIAIDGGIVTVGASRDDDNGVNSGSAYLFDLNPRTVFRPTVKLLADDGAERDAFGSAIALSDGIAVAGASGEDDNGSNSGSAYLFDADPDSISYGLQLVKILPDDGAANDAFGDAIGIDGGIVAVGVASDEDNGFFSGSAYLFDAHPDSPTFGQQLVKILPEDGFIGDRFGSSIGIDDGIVAVGARNAGSAYLFDADPDSPAFGQQLRKLLPEDGAEIDFFGNAIAISDGIAAIGAVFDDPIALDSGSAYLFDADPDSPTFGQQLVKLLPEDGAGADFFGGAIGIDGGIVAVGAFGDDDNGSRSGSAYLFDADPDSPTFGQQLVKILPKDGAANDAFGDAIGIDGGIVTVGALGDDDNGSDSGSAYLFDADPDSPTFGQQLVKILPEAGAELDFFGGAIGIDGGIVATGVIGDDDNGNSSGSAYLFNFNPRLKPNLVVTGHNEDDLIFNWGTVGDITASSFGFIVRNDGFEPIAWNAGSADHPVFVQNAYIATELGLFPVGQGYAHHPAGLFSSGPSLGGTALLPGSEETVFSFFSGFQADLGPRADIDPTTGAFPFPFTQQDEFGDAIFKRVQADDAAIDEFGDMPSLIILETLGVSADEIAQGGPTSDNIASFAQPLSKAPGVGSPEPAIVSYSGSDPEVMLAEAIPGDDADLDGTVLVASRVLDQGGQYAYAYMVFNQTSDRAVASITIPTPGAGSITLGDRTPFFPFRHSGEELTHRNDPWTVTGGTPADDAITFSVPTMDADPASNRIGWGTMYTFLFFSSNPPAEDPGEVVLGVWDTGEGSGGAGPEPTDGLYTVQLTVPGEPVQGCSPADLADEFGVLNFNDVIEFLNLFAAMDPAANFDAKNPAINFNDVITFLTIFADGCPSEPMP